MTDETIQEVREKLIKIEVLLENMNKNNDLKAEIVEEKIKVANNRISDLESSNTWLWRTVTGAFIGSAIAFLMK